MEAIKEQSKYSEVHLSRLLNRTPMNRLCGHTDLSAEMHGARDPHAPAQSYRMASLTIRILSRELSRRSKTEQIESLQDEILLRVLAYLEHWEDHA